MKKNCGSRLEAIQNRTIDYKSFNPYYLIITDDYKKIEHLNIISQMLKTRVNVGFSLLCLTNNLIELPNECKTFINIEQNAGTMFESELSSRSQKDFAFDVSPIFLFEKIGRQLSGIPIKASSIGKLSLPETYTFLEMYDVRKS